MDVFLDWNIPIKLSQQLSGDYIGDVVLQLRNDPVKHSHTQAVINLIDEKAGNQDFPDPSIRWNVNVNVEEEDDAENEVVEEELVPVDENLIDEMMGDIGVDVV